MIKFEKHEGKLFRMLESPVPLTDDTELPVLVRMIQDDTMLGKANKRISNPNTLAQKIICSNLTDGGLFLGGNYAYRYEIIGAFVEEGSEDWAWHMMQEGYKTKHCESTSQRFYAIRKGNNYCAFYDNEWKEVDINTRRTYCEFIEYAKAFPGYGWRILKEHEQPKPLLADAKVGDLCKRRDGKWVQIDEIDDEFSSLPPAYRCGAGWWTEKGASVHNQTLDIIHTEPLATEETKEWALQMMKLGKCVCHVKAPSIKYHRPTHYVKRVVRENCTDDMSDAVWMKGADPTGWQLYEPKEKPPKEPDYVICKRCGGTGYEIKEPCDAPNPESATQSQLSVADATQYKVGDWVEHKESKEQATIRRIMSYGAIEIEFAYSTESDIYQADDFHNDFRKLKPFEIVVRIGCLSGTIGKSCEPACFLMWHSSPRMGFDYSIIKLSALDKQTRELVEGLLEAQERGDIK